MSQFLDETDCCGDSLVAFERDALLRRCVADPRRTPEAITWAADRLLEDEGCGRGPDGELSARTVRVALAHLSAQRCALDAAYRQLVPARAIADRVADARADGLHEAYFELLRALPRHVDWCCDGGAPCADAARKQLAFRVGRRGIDAWRQVAHMVSVDDVAAFGSAPAADTRGHDFRELYAYLRSRLPKAEHPKLERFVLHALLDVSQEAIARENRMSPAAVRKESSRFAKRIAGLIDAYGG